MKGSVNGVWRQVSAAVGVLGVALVLGIIGEAALAEGPDWAPAEAQPVMAIDEVRVGMKGYGLTVYHGDTIEPFPVVVKSVVFNSDPKRSVIWVDCTDERMQRYGPVQGMSGSPIYLWEEGQEGVMGEGGRLIGAFAFGFADTNEALAGVQPIAYMRETGGRADLEQVAGGVDLRAKPGAAVSMLRAYRKQAAQASTPWRSGVVNHASTLVSRTGWGRALSSDAKSQTALRGTAWEGSATNGATRLSLPVNVGSTEAASAIAPMMAGSGLIPVAGGSFGSMSTDGGMAGLVPSNVTPDEVKLEPGSVLAVPLAFGDYVPAAAGTVTDVLPDGTVLGFGHAMDGVGDTALPMATGYTHYVVSRRSISFKWTGVLGLVGSLVQDESAAVAGLPGRAFTTSPVNVSVTMPEQNQRGYAYEVVNHPSYTPSIAVLMPIVSMLAVNNPPDENMMHVTGQWTFSNGRTLDLDSVIPFGGPQAFAFEFAPTMGVLLQNEFEDVELVSADYDIDFEPGVELTFIESLSVSPSAAKPGDTVTVRVVTRDYDGPAETHTTTFTVPLDMTEGELPIVAAGADDFVNFEIMNDPKYAILESSDELFDAFGRFLTLERESLHLAMLRPRFDETSLAIGNASLEHLPSHHAAMLMNPGSTAMNPLSPVVPSLTQKLPLGRVVAGEQSVMLRVLGED
ncbi:MAG: SpoIVB peptidase S55 domain-containing protein [Planctomycetota bacterium]